MNYGLLKNLLFRLDPETAHNLAIKAIKNGWVKAETVQKPVTHFGVTFPNPVGLAAGFDKNAVALNQWKNLGFGFVEVGTVTRHAQPGNPKPRLFRLIEDQAIINRMGFNNEGADVMARRFEKADPGIPVGINLGKSKITELSDAPEDYAYSFKLLKDHGDYFVVNVSSPNTPGLRELQDADHLTRILWRLREIDTSKPLFVKIAPDLTEEAVDSVVQVARDFSLTGIVATNTTTTRPNLKIDPNQEGGLSGAPLKPLADQTLQWLQARKGEDLTLIGVGGISTPQDAQQKFQNGADLIQIYTAWIYKGPDFIPTLVKSLLT